MIPSLTNEAYELHLLAGLVIAWAGGRRWLAIVAAAAIGKEVIDYFYHGLPDVLDVFFTLLGGFTYKLMAWKRSISS